MGAARALKLLDLRTLPSYVAMQALGPIITPTTHRATVEGLRLRGEGVILRGGTLVREPRHTCGKKKGVNTTASWMSASAMQGGIGRLSLLGKPDRVVKRCFLAVRSISK